MGPGALQKLGAPILLETLALYSYITFKNTKVAKIGRGSVFFQIELTPKEFFGTEIDENEIQNCKSLEQTLKTSLFVGVSQVKQSNCFRRLDKLVLPSSSSYLLAQKSMT